jgi:hypothetical protein
MLTASAVNPPPPLDQSLPLRLSLRLPPLRLLLRPDLDLQQRNRVPPSSYIFFMMVVHTFIEHEHPNSISRYLTRYLNKT